MEQEKIDENNNKPLTDDGEKVKERRSLIPRRIPATVDSHGNDNVQMAVSVNYPYSSKRQRPSVTKKHDNWTKLVAALNAKRFAMKTDDEGESNDEEEEADETEMSNGVQENDAEFQDNERKLPSKSRKTDTNTIEHEKEDPSKELIPITDISCPIKRQSKNEEEKCYACCKMPEIPIKKVATTSDTATTETNDANTSDSCSFKLQMVQLQGNQKDKNRNSRTKSKKTKDVNGQINGARVMQDVATAAQTSGELVYPRINKSTQKSEMSQEPETKTNTSQQSVDTNLRIAEIPKPQDANPTEKSLQGKIIRVIRPVGPAPSPRIPAAQIPESEIPSLKQRNMELHRLRVLVERKRLQLLDMKLQREHEDMARARIAFQRELKYANAQFRHTYEEKDI